MKFISAPLPTVPPSFATDFAAYSAALAVCLTDPTKPYHVPETGDFGPHAAEIAERLMSVDPSGFASYILHRAAGDEAKAVEGLHAALMTAFEIDPNLFTIHGGVSKDLNRWVLREFLTDTASADATADYAGPGEARASAYKICAERGWNAADLIPKAVELGNAIRQDAVDREQQHIADSRERVRIKSAGGDPIKSHRRHRLFR